MSRQGDAGGTRRGHVDMALVSHGTMHLSVVPDQAEGCGLCQTGANLPDDFQDSS
jgi:hypothetical protein